MKRFHAFIRLPGAKHWRYEGPSDHDPQGILNAARDEDCDTHLVDSSRNISMDLGVALSALESESSDRVG